MSRGWRIFCSVAPLWTALSEAVRAAELYAGREVPPLTWYGHSMHANVALLALVLLWQREDRT